MLKNLTALQRADGGKLAIPPASILFVEDVKREVKAQSPRAVSGIFYDLGGGPESVLLSVPFPRVIKLAERASPATWLQLCREGGERVAIRSVDICALRSEEEEEVKATVRHRIGNAVYALRVVETFDEIQGMTDADDQLADGDGAETAEEGEENGGEHGTGDHEPSGSGSDGEAAGGLASPASDG